MNSASIRRAAFNPRRKNKIKTKPSSVWKGAGVDLTIAGPDKRL
jgi:hypothetical protein